MSAPYSWVRVTDAGTYALTRDGLTTGVTVEPRPDGAISMWNGRSLAGIATTTQEATTMARLLMGDDVPPVPAGVLRG